MSKIIEFHSNPVSELKRQLKDKTDELERIRSELAFFKQIYSSTASIGDLLKLQMADLTANVSLLQSHLGIVQENLKNIKAKIDELEKMRQRIRVINNPNE